MMIDPVSLYKRRCDILSKCAKERKEELLTLPDIVEVDRSEESMDTDALILEPLFCSCHQFPHQVCGMLRYISIIRELQAFLKETNTSMQL